MGDLILTIKKIERLNSLKKLLGEPKSHISYNKGTKSAIKPFEIV